MSIQGSYGQNYGQSLSTLASFISSQNSRSSVKIPEFFTNKTSKANQLADAMSSFGGSTGPGSVVMSSLPGLGYANGGMKKLPSYSKASVQDDYLTKSEPKMSEKQFEAAIKALAEKNAAAGIVEDVGRDYFELASSYVSVVSPDRKSIIDGASPISLVPSKANHTMATAYDDDGKVVATYNPTKGWSNLFTDDEKARNAKFDSIYWSAYNAYKAANNQETVEDDGQIENAVVGSGEDEEQHSSNLDVSA